MHKQKLPQTQTNHDVVLLHFSAVSASFAVNLLLVAVMQLQVNLCLIFFYPSNCGIFNNVPLCSADLWAMMPGTVYARASVKFTAGSLLCVRASMNS